MPSGGAIVCAAERLPVARCRRRGWRIDHERRAAAGLEADVGAVAVEVLALAREAGRRVEELAVVRVAGAERVGATRRRSPRCRSGSGPVETQWLSWLELRERASAGCGPRRRGPGAAPRAASRHRPAPSGRAARRPARATVCRRDRRRQLRDARADARARARNGGSASFRWASDGRASSSVGASSRIEAERLADSAARAPVVVLKLVIRSLSGLVGRGERANRSRWPRTRCREVVRMLAQQRLVHDRSRPARRCRRSGRPG